MVILHASRTTKKTSIISTLFVSRESLLQSRRFHRLHSDEINLIYLAVITGKSLGRKSLTQLTMITENPEGCCWAVGGGGGCWDREGRGGRGRRL